MGFPRRVYLRPGEPEVTGPIRELVPLPFRRWGHQLHVARRSPRFLDLMVCRPTRLNGAEGYNAACECGLGDQSTGVAARCVALLRGSPLHAMRERGPPCRCTQRAGIAPALLAIAGITALPGILAKLAVARARRHARLAVPVCCISLPALQAIQTLLSAERNHQ